MGKVVKKITSPIKKVAKSVFGDNVGTAVGAIIGGPIGAQIGSGIDASSAIKKGANAQIQSAQDALALQKAIYADQMAQQQPFRQAGLDAQNRLLQYMGLGGDRASPNYGKYTGDFGMNDFDADPGYSFRLNEGLKALDRQAAARGGLISGGALKAAQRYGQDMASQEYQNAFNRYQVNRSNQLNPLQSLLGSGQTATNQLGAYGSQYGANAGNIGMGIGNTRASSYIGQQNAVSGGINNALGTVTDIFKIFG